MNTSILGRLLASQHNEPVVLVNKKDVIKQIKEEKQQMAEDDDDYDLRGLIDKVICEKPKKLKTIRGVMKIVINEKENEYNLNHEL